VRTPRARTRTRRHAGGSAPFTGAYRRWAAAPRDGTAGRRARARRRDASHVAAPANLFPSAHPSSTVRAVAAALKSAA
jgi:hypothetical protein